MSLRLYRDALLAEPISRDGAQTQPDLEASLNGTAGQAAEANLYLAPERAKLSVAVGTLDGTTFTIDRAAFGDSNYAHGIIDSEEVLITAGHGTNTLTVSRAYNGSTPALHSQNAVLYLIYNYSDIKISADDVEGTDESGYLEYSLDAGVTWYSALDGAGGNAQPVDMNYADTAVTVRRKCTIPAGHAVLRRIDLRHVVTFTAEVPQA